MEKVYGPEARASYYLIFESENQIFTIEDPITGSFTDLVFFMNKRISPQIRKVAFNKMLVFEGYDKLGDIFFMTGAKPNETEIQTAIKLSSNGYYVIFPNEGQLYAIKNQLHERDDRKNDVFLYDKKSFKQYRADLKTAGSPSIETIVAHIRSGSGQASTIVLDITGRISKTNLIKGLRLGWAIGTKMILLSYKGRWYEIDKHKLFNNKWLIDNIQ
jgi:hypothetical protein